jgi:VPDSG-CTERM motif
MLFPLARNDRSLLVPYVLANHWEDLRNFFFMDDISVTPTGVPDGGTTVSLLGCALLGLAAFRRKLSC